MVDRPESLCWNDRMFKKKQHKPRLFQFDANKLSIQKGKPSDIFWFRFVSNSKQTMLNIGHWTLYGMILDADTCENDCFLIDLLYRSIEIWSYGTVRWPHTYHSLTFPYTMISLELMIVVGSCMSEMNGLFFGTMTIKLERQTWQQRKSFRSTFSSDVKCGDKYCIVEYSPTKYNKYVIKKIHRAKIECTLSKRSHFGTLT